MDVRSLEPRFDPVMLESHWREDLLSRMAIQSMTTDTDMPDAFEQSNCELIESLLDQIQSPSGIKSRSSEQLRSLYLACLAMLTTAPAEFQIYAASLLREPHSKREA